MCSFAFPAISDTSCYKLLNFRTIVWCVSVNLRWGSAFLGLNGDMSRIMKAYAKARTYLLRVYIKAMMKFILNDIDLLSLLAHCMPKLNYIRVVGS